MKNYQNFMMFFTFFMFWFSIQFGDIVEDSVAFVLIVSLGILHGANDLLILAKGKNSKMFFFKTPVGLSDNYYRLCADLFIQSFYCYSSVYFTKFLSFWRRTSGRKDKSQSNFQLNFLPVLWCFSILHTFLCFINSGK